MTALRPHPLIAQLADERRRRGLSQVAAARRAGISVSSLTAWEAGALPNLTALQCYLDALGLRLVAIPADAPTPIFRRSGQQTQTGSTVADEGGKVCPRCHEPRSLTEFTVDRSRRDGLAWQCRFCAAGQYRQRKGGITQEAA